MYAQSSPNLRALREYLYHGLMFGSGDTIVEDDLIGDMETFVAQPSAPAESGANLAGEYRALDERASLLALVSGGRHAAVKAARIEIAAAQLARELDPPVTLRELAAAAGITERAAAARYRRLGADS